MRSPADQAAYEKSLHPGMLEGWTGGGNFGFALARGNSETTNLALGIQCPAQDHHRLMDSECGIDLLHRRQGWEPPLPISWAA